MRKSLNPSLWSNSQCFLNCGQSVCLCFPKLPAGNFFNVLILTIFTVIGIFNPAQAVQIDREPIEPELVLGVYENQDKQQILVRYQGLADFLSEQIDGANVRLEVLNASEIREAMRLHRLDMVLPNPSLYEVLRNENKLGGVLATVETISEQGRQSSKLGGVIFTQATNTEVLYLEDIAHKKIAIPNFDFTGAYQVPLFEAIESGIKRNDLKFVTLGTQDAVVNAVLNREAEVGFVRTGVLENWFETRGLNPKSIRIINAKKDPGFPYLLSTRLYPEWPFIVTDRLDSDLVRQVSAALFSLHKAHPAAIQAGIAGFVPPKDYISLETLLRKLRLSPYDEVPEFSFVEAIKEHPAAFLMGLAMIVVLSIAFGVSMALRARVKEKTKRFDELLAATDAMTWEWNLTTGIVEINDSWAEILGFSLEELAPFNSKKWWNLMHPDDRAHVDKMLNAYLQGEVDFYEAEFRLRHKYNYWFWVMARGQVVARGKDGRPLRMSGIHIDINDLKLKELKLEFRTKRDKILLDLPIYADEMNEKDFMQHAQALTEELTQSKISFIHIMNDDQQTIELVAWSKRTLDEYCNVPETQTHYPLENAGIWADAARQIAPVVVNDYASYPHKKGLPAGHASLDRLVSVPVIENGRVVMLTGVGNKSQDYTEQDVETVQLISSEIWRLVQRKRIQQTIIEQTTQYQRLVNDLGPDHVVFSFTGKMGELLYVSETVEGVFGVKAQDIIGKTWGQAIQWLPESLELALGCLNKILSGLEGYNQFDMRFIHPKTQNECIVKITQHAVFDEFGTIVSIDGLAVNVTSQKASERKLEEAARVFEYAQEGILIANPEGAIVNVNAAFTRITGFKKSDVLGKNPNILSSGKQSESFYSAMWEQINQTGHWYGEIWNRRKNGEIYPQKINITTIRSEDGEVQQYIALFADISIEKQQQAELEFIAHFDPLTGLPNRVLLTDRLNQAVAYSDRHKTELAVAFIDLDGFKEVNDIHGHSAGDKLLETLAKRFDKVVRKGDTVSRMGGDEFVVIFPELTSRESLTPVLNRMLDEAKKPFEFQGLSLNVSASIGVALYDGMEESVSADLLLRYADQAMYQAKIAGKNQIAFFENFSSLSASDVSILRQKLEEIEAGMNANEFELLYQPKLHVYHQEIIELEALIRWRKSDGLIPPYQFLPYLDGQSLGLRLGYWVIEEAIKCIAHCKHEGVTCSISVNVDGFQFQQPDFVEQVQEIFSRYPEVQPSQMTMELLESSALDDINSVTSIINQLRELGLRFAIDDFGAGYASLNYLKRLPVDELKIDQSFIKDIFEEPQGMVILESVVAMAKAFDMQVVAEGVETKEHIDLLLKLGLEVLQGYAISYPMEASKLMEWVEQHQDSKSWDRVDSLNRSGVMKTIALFELKKWMANARNCINGEETCEHLAFKSPVTCGFGSWLYADGRDLLNYKLFSKIESYHDELHDLVETAIALKADGKTAEAKKLLNQVDLIEKKVLELVEAD